MTIRHSDGEEVFPLESAILTAFQRPDCIELYFHVEVVDPEECPVRTGAEVHLYRTGFDPSRLAGRSFEIPEAYSGSRRNAGVTYRRSGKFLNNVILRVIDREGDLFRIHWTGDFRRGDTDYQVVIEGRFEFQGFKPKFKDIQLVTDFLEPFPAYENVFSDPLPLHRKHFLPLLSVNAAVIHEDLGWLHFVSPIEPLMEGNVGGWTRQHHDFYNQIGQVAFHVHDGKYSFTGDFNFFLYESGIPANYPYTEAEVREDYQSRLTSYEIGRERYLEHRTLAGRRGRFMNQLGGQLISTNWGNQLPRNRSGKPFRWIGEVEGFQYCSRTATAICLYYDSEEQIALFRYDWD